LLDTAIGALGNAGLQYLATGKPPARSGNRHLVAAPIDLFATATAPIYLAMATDRLFVDLCAVIGRPDLPIDDRFSSPSGRSRNRDALKDEIEAALTTKPAEVWLADMAHLPAGAVRTIDEALQAPEVLERDMVRRIDDDDGPIDVLGTSFKFTDNPVAEFRPPPRLGEHTDDVLASVLAMTDEQIAELRRSGAVS
jgi:crotonobetainyl-CoA:carnitine CoA-transferase CaiB-like acyl-CoA transferase